MAPTRPVARPRLLVVVEGIETDFYAQLPNNDPRRFTELGIIARDSGYCACSSGCNGERRWIKGRTFWAHMEKEITRLDEIRDRHNAILLPTSKLNVPSASSSTILSFHDSRHRPDKSPTPVQNPVIEMPSESYEPMESFDDFYGDAGGGSNHGDSAERPVDDLMPEVADEIDEVEDLGFGDGEREDDLDLGMLGMMEESREEDDEGEEGDNPAENHDDELPPANSASANPTPLHPQFRRIEDVFPFPIESCLLNFPYSGRLPRPSEEIPDKSSTLSFQTLFSCCKAIFSSAFHNVTNAGSAFQMKQDNSENVLVQQATIEALCQRENLNVKDYTDLDISRDPVFTLKTAQRRVCPDPTIIQHPVCPHSDCNHVYYSITRVQNFGRLSRKCVECSRSLFDSRGPMVFARVPLKTEMERILGRKGVEKMIESFQAQDQSTPASTVRKEQRDGTAWGVLLGHDGKPFNTYEKGDNNELRLTINLSWDGSSPNSGRNTAPYSYGPFCGQIADLPNAFRSSMAYMLLFGITPGPKEPKGHNLWKFSLPLALEFLEAWKEGFWIATADHPEKRLVRLAVGCICCDRPAATAMIGAAGHSSELNGCLRCHVHKSDLDPTKISPARNWEEHIRRINSEILEMKAEGKLSEFGTFGWMEKISNSFQGTGHLSAFAILPYLDGFLATKFDPMHLILLGVHGPSFETPEQAKKAPEVAEEDGEAGVEGLAFGDVGMGAAGGSGGEAGKGMEVEGNGGSEVAAGGDRSHLAGQKDGEGRQGNGQSKGKTAPKGKGKQKDKGPEFPASSILREADLILLDSIIPTIASPRYLGCWLHENFGFPSAGNPTADQWRFFATVVGPMVMPFVFYRRSSAAALAGTGRKHNPRLIREELDVLMRLFEVTDLALRPEISDQQCDLLSELISDVEQLAKKLHPRLNKVSNMHCANHLPEDIRLSGPIYGWWNFSFERLQKTLKAFNSNGRIGQKETSTIRHFLQLSIKDILCDMLDWSAESLPATPLRALAITAAETMRSSLPIDTKLLSKQTDNDTAYQPELLKEKKSYLHANKEAMSLVACYRKQNINVTTHDRFEEDSQVLPVDIKEYSTLKIGKREFSSSKVDDTRFESKSIDLRDFEDSLVQFRDTRTVFGAQSSRVYQTGIITRIFKHSLVGGGGKLFLTLRSFVPYRGQDNVYRPADTENAVDSQVTDTILKLKNLDAGQL